MDTKKDLKKDVFNLFNSIVTFSYFLQNQPN